MSHKAPQVAAKSAAALRFFAATVLGVICLTKAIDGPTVLPLSYR